MISPFFPPRSKCYFCHIPISYLCVLLFYWFLSLPLFSLSPPTPILHCFCLHLYNMPKKLVATMDPSSNCFDNSSPFFYGSVKNLVVIWNITALNFRSKFEKNWLIILYPCFSPLCISLVYTIFWTFNK